MKRHILLDMDGVIADFVEGARLAHEAAGNTIDVSQYSLGMDEADFWKPINAAGYKFWESLPALPWLDELVLLITSYVGDEWSICTKPSNDPFCAAGKIMWLKKHFGEDFKRYILIKHKQHLAKPGYVLIDDHDDNVNRFREHGGDAILFPQTWNTNRHLVLERMGHVRFVLNRIMT